MEFIRGYYFDFGLMGDEFGAVLEGFWLTIKLSILGGALSLIWGLVLAVLRQLPGRPLAPVRWLSIAVTRCTRDPSPGSAGRWPTVRRRSSRRACGPPSSSPSASRQPLIAPRKVRALR